MCNNCGGYFLKTEETLSNTNSSFILVRLLFLVTDKRHWVFFSSKIAFWIPDRYFSDEKNPHLKQRLFCDIQLMVLFLLLTSLLV